ncbi:hypothetical protein ACFL3T_03485 [Patescibacteria group bacterium]
MKKILSDASYYDGKEYRISDKGKFIMRNINGEVQAVLFSNKNKHLTVAYFELKIPKQDFVGAGKVKFKVEDNELSVPSDAVSKFDSSSCSFSELYGFDRPSDDSEAEKLIQELNELINGII